MVPVSVLLLYLMFFGLILVLHEEHKEMMEAELREEETGRAIDGMKSGKTAGPDGIPVDFFFF